MANVKEAENHTESFRVKYFSFLSMLSRIVLDQVAESLTSWKAAEPLAREIELVKLKITTLWSKSD